MGVYHDHNVAEKLQTMRDVTDAHKRRVAAMTDTWPDAPLSTQAGRDYIRKFQTLVCSEAHQYEAEIRAANDNTLIPANARDVAATYKVCDDGLQIIDLADKATWVDSVSGEPVIKDGPLKDQMRTLIATLDADQKTLDAAEKVAKDAYKQDQELGKTQ
jgi:hypothetical protein